MKKLLLLLAVVLFTGPAFAQKDSLAIDEHNKYIYYQVVPQPDISTDTLYNRALYFFTSAYPKSKLKLTTEDRGKGTLLGTGSFLVSKKSLITSHEDGSIAFTMHIEVKDGKYRYWMTDFVFNPYQRNRYNSYEPVPGIYIPLEEAKGKIEKKDLSTYMDGVLTSCRSIGAKLKEYILKTSSIKKERQIKKISTKDW